MNAASRRYAVIGHPVAQSRSPEIHAAFAEATGIALEYTRLLAPLDGFSAAVRDFFAAGGDGLNVTVPFKPEAAQLADTVSERVRAAGAANCLRLHDGRIEAENFDGVGLVRDLEVNLGQRLDGARVLLVGAGGAARGVIGPLLESGVRSLRIANRTFERAQALAASFDPEARRVRAISLQDVQEDRPRFEAPFDVVIDATSTSLSEEPLRLSRTVFGPGSLAYSMVYGKGWTPFLREAHAAGARVADGLGMLVEQAAESFAWWHGVRPPVADVLRHLERSLPRPL
ncbi:MAG: shikimate dehydrogenase [Casimicrobiaceae bacterium]|nr:shikimate dehydrogenase [Casimicrobiaceae bacterium]